MVKSVRRAEIRTAWRSRYGVLESVRRNEVRAIAPSHPAGPGGAGCNLGPMDTLVALEGLHALKHALRFGAQVEEIDTDDLDRALALAQTIAPDLGPVLAERARGVASPALRARAAQPIPTHVLAFAHRPGWTLAQTRPSPAHPVVLLDDPRNSKNLGAVVRVAAAAGAAAVLALGAVDFFDPMAVRGAAGLQWALPCWASPHLLDELDDEWEADRPQMVGLDADGSPFDPAGFSQPTIFAFGSERSGLSQEVRRRCDAIVSLPMTPHVSSLNLATAVSAVLYLRLYSGLSHSVG